MDIGDWKGKSSPCLPGMSTARPRCSGRETVEFSVKGPVPICLEDEAVSLPGCSILDITFTAPSAVGELVFRNYYTAWLSVLVKTEQNGTWTLSISHKNLMPSPHEETGSHDLTSIVATESSLQWKNLLVMRLVLRQPSPIWRVFHVEEINVYADLPRLTAVNSVAGETEAASTSEQYDKLLALVRRQTLAALYWAPSESKSASSPRISIRDQQKGACGYEITKLPQV